MGRVCPWWVGYLLANPLRRLIQDPERILRPYLAEGMVAVDIGCGMGYFSIPMAKLVGSRGKVISVDLQERMLASLRSRAGKAGVLERMEIRQATGDSLHLEDRAGTADFVLAFSMVHEVPNRPRLFYEVGSLLKNGGTLLLSEPKGHVTKQAFAATMSIAEAFGLTDAAVPGIRWQHSAVLVKK